MVIMRSRALSRWIVAYHRFLRHVDRRFAAETGKAPWVGYIIYALCVGVGFSLILLVPGVSTSSIDRLKLSASPRLASASCSSSATSAKWISRLWPLSRLALAHWSSSSGIVSFFGIWYLAVSRIPGQYDRSSTIGRFPSSSRYHHDAHHRLGRQHHVAKRVEKGERPIKTSPSIAPSIIYSAISSVIFVRILYILIDWRRIGTRIGKIGARLPGSFFFGFVFLS
jgi:hypothetical protein